jgi:hypothetical protein
VNCTSAAPALRCTCASKDLARRWVKLARMSIPGACE